MTINKIWIDKGCISCNSCESECPSVFCLTDGDCVINADVRTDGITSSNRNEKAVLKPNLDPRLEASIVAAVASCPVKAIKIELKEHRATSEIPSITKKVKPPIHDKKSSPGSNKHAMSCDTLPLPSLKLYLEDKARDQERKAVSPNASSTVKTTANDIAIPLPTVATDDDLARLQNLLGSKVEEVFQQAGELTCQVVKENIFEALALCRNDQHLSYEMLSDQTGTHYPNAKDFSFSVVYHLTSISRNKRIRLRILIPQNFEPESAVPLYPAANWLEREIWDMLGIRFKNHPNMTRILCPEGWEGHALRKDYPTEGLGQRNVDFREDRGGTLMRIATEKANNIKINTNPPKAE